MPFIETYSVKFSDSNKQLHPHVNLMGWPDMVRSPATPNDPATQDLDSFGLNLTLTRNSPAAESRSSVFLVLPGSDLVVLPGSLLLNNTRLLMRITFDKPLAVRTFEGPIGSKADYSSLAGEEKPSLQPSVPEPWAVALIVSPDPNMSADTSRVNVTCQFRREQNVIGVRLNTPRGVQGFGGALQNDQAANLQESSPDYTRWGGLIPFADDNDDPPVPPPGRLPPLDIGPIFTLSHSFCGRDNATNNHTAGSGFLKISGSGVADVEDHRVYSNNSLLPDVTIIRALGMSLATREGFGKMSMRLRTFELWFNPGPPLPLA